MVPQDRGAKSNGDHKGAVLPEHEVNEMKSFELYEPKTVNEAVGILGKFGKKARPLAGGSDLVAGVMKDWVEGAGMPLPDALVDLTTIPQLKGIKVDAKGATIGAITTLAEITESKELTAQFPLLTSTAHSVASQLIRNFGTLGGNINQRPRSCFFRGKDFNCFKKGGDFCYSVNGDNRYHAIIGGESCYIVHPSDTATALLALNAQANVAVAAAFQVANDTWTDGRVVLGGVAPVHYRATVIENQLKGKNIQASIKQAAAAIRTVARPMSMNAFKVDIAQTMIERTILSALA